MIDVQNLVFQYPNSDVNAVDDISFSVGEGEIFGFLGPSGAGKSTTQKILTGLLKNYQGQASVFGTPLNAATDSYYEDIGVSFELPNHYQKLSGIENLQFFASLYSGETHDPAELLALVGLSEDAEMRVSQYSKGMQMRLGFVRALLHRPKLLFLDEPTSGLDPVNARNIRELIRAEKSAGRAIFLTTHDMSVADELCDRVAFIVDGKLALIDSPRDLKLQHGKRRVRVEAVTDKGLTQHEFDLTDLGQNAEFQALLNSGTIETMHTQEATLEDVFIAVTGRSLR